MMDILGLMFWRKNKRKLAVMQAKTDEESIKKKLTFFERKMGNKKILQPFEIFIVWKSQEGLERCPD